MSYRALKLQVAAAERRVEAHLQGAGDQTRAIGTTLKQSYTPSRLLLAGFVGGVLTGWLQPLRHAGALTSLLRLATGLQPPLAVVASWLAAVPRAPTAHGADAGAARQQRPG